MGDFSKRSQGLCLEPRGFIQTPLYVPLSKNNGPQETVPTDIKTEPLKTWFLRYTLTSVIGDGLYGHPHMYICTFTYLPI